MPLKIFAPWSRLSFGISLLQFIVIPFAYLQSTNSFTFRIYDLVKEFFVIIMFTFVLSNVAYLFMEGPLISLYKHYIGQEQRSEIKKEWALDERTNGSSEQASSHTMANRKHGDLKND